MTYTLVRVTVLFLVTCTLVRVTICLMTAWHTAVIGGGSWGTALAKLIADKHGPTSLWAREPDVVESINKRHCNERYLKGIDLPHELVASSDLKLVLNAAQLVLWVVPSQFTRAVLKEAQPLLASDVVHLSCAKGIENESLSLVSEIFEQELAPQRFAALGGPSFAREVALDHPTAVLVASQDLELAKKVQHFISTETFRIYTSDDIIGVELGGALKNVIAIAAGAAVGLGFGHNSVASIVTRGLGEMTRLAIKLGAKAQTLSGLSGLGDLMLTCTGELSRNRRVGMELGQGRSLIDIERDLGMVAEGVKTAKSVHFLAEREQLELPIFEAAYRVLYQGETAADALKKLMTRSLKSEFPVAP